MYPEHIYLRRLQRFAGRIHHKRYTVLERLNARCLVSHDGPVPFSVAKTTPMKAIETDTRWGRLWDRAWFRFQGHLKDSWDPDHLVALIDIGAEGAVVNSQGVPVYGLTYKFLDDPNASFVHIKRRIPVSLLSRSADGVDFFVDASANGLFGKDSRADFTLRQAELAVFRPAWWQLYLNVAFLLETAQALPEDHPRRHDILEQLNDIANTWEPGGEDDGLEFEATKAVPKVGETPPAEVVAKVNRVMSVPAEEYRSTLWAVGHAHLDLGWLWPVSETKRKGARTFATALRLLEEYPDYYFGASQPQLYQWIEDEYPDLFAAIEQRVKEGRWEPQGAMWVEPDTMVTGGESLVRQCLYGKRYFQERFGVEVDTLWLPDAFGFSPSMPQILRQAGVTRFVSQKISWNEMNTFPYTTFVWEGIDGSEVLAHFLPANNYNAENRPEELLKAESRIRRIHGEKQALHLYGVGDGGGGPSRAHIEYARRARDTAGLPRVKFGISADFFASIEAASNNPQESDPDNPGASDVATRDRPRWVGELYLEMHRGTLTSQAEMKRLNRRLETELKNVEILSAIASTSAYAYPKSQLEAIWKQTLLNQFHDILPGSSIRRVYEVAHEQSRRNLATLSRLQTDALGHLFGRSGEEAFVLINTLSWDRKAVVPLPSTTGIPVDAETGEILPHQRDEHTCYVYAGVPGLGYSTVVFKTAEEQTKTNGSPRIRAEQDLLENDLVLVRLGERGQIVSLFDKRAQRETFPGEGNRLLLWEDRPYEWDAWDISHYYREGPPEQPTLIERRVLTDGAVTARLQQTLKIGVSTITQIISLNRDSPVVDIQNTVDWQEKHKVLRVSASTGIRSDYGTYEMQFGHYRRSTRENTPWERAQFEVAAHRYADLSEPGFGCSLMNDSKYGHRIHGDSIELTLLRAPTFPDREADIGTHRFAYAYMPHDGSPELTETIHSSHEMNADVLVYGAETKPETSTGQWLSASGSTVILDTLKQSEDNDGLVLRMYEPSGRHQQCVLHTTLPVTGAQQSDIMENRIPTNVNRNVSEPTRFRPFEIKTYRFSTQ